MSERPVPAVEVEELRFSYPGDSFRLHVPTLVVAPGEHVALVGTSGCGKTTLARLIAGIERPQAGRIAVGGRRIDSLSDAQRRLFRARHIGFVFQAFELLEYLPARDNILLPYRLNRGLDPGGAPTRAETLSAELGIGHLLGRHPDKLSQGERQRVAIARALVTQPALLLADEPTGNLDPANTGIILDLLLGQARARGTTLVVITHDATVLDRFDRVLDLAGGAP